MNSKEIHYCKVPKQSLNDYLLKLFWRGIRHAQVVSEANGYLEIKYIDTQFDAWSKLFKEWLYQRFKKDNHPKYIKYWNQWFQCLTFEQTIGFYKQFKRLYKKYGCMRDML